MRAPFRQAKLAILEKKKLAFQASVKNGVEDLKESIRERAEGVLKDAPERDPASACLHRGRSCCCEEGTGDSPHASSP